MLEPTPQQVIVVKPPTPENRFTNVPGCGYCAASGES